MKKLLALTLSALVASACTASGLKRSEGDQVLAKYDGYIGEPVREFNAFQQQSWQPVSRNQLILWTSTSDAYLLTTAPGCQDLMFANAIRVTSTGSKISTFENVIARGHRCPIQKIQPIDVRQWREDRKSS